MKNLYLSILLFIAVFSFPSNATNFDNSIANLSESITCPDSILCDLTINGGTITGFDVAITTYDVIISDTSGFHPPVGFFLCDTSINYTWTIEDGSLPGSSLFTVEFLDSCIETYTINWLLEPLSIADNASITFEVYPNPAKEYINILMSNALNTSLSLVDLSGRVLELVTLEEGQEEYQLDVSEYASGVYFIEVVQDGNLMKSEKLILE